MSYFGFSFRGRSLLLVMNDELKRGSEKRVEEPGEHSLSASVTLPVFCLFTL